MNTRDETLRQGFKVMNRFMLPIWRLGLGRWMNVWPEVMGQYLVITHTGRKSGLRRRTPVNFAIVNGEIYVMAGFGIVCDWYRNLKAHPEAEVWLGDSWWQVCAEEVPVDENNLPVLKAVVIGSGFAARLFGGIDIKRITDEELLSMAKDYRLLHLKRLAARTGTGGPGDLAWVWPVATLLLLLTRTRGRERSSQGVGARR